MLRQAIFIAQPDRGIRLKKISDQLKDFWKRLSQIAAGRQRACQAIQRSGAFLAPTLGLLTLVQLRRKMSDDNGDNKIGTKHHEVFEFADVKSEAWWDEKEVPEQRAE